MVDRIKMPRSFSCSWAREQGNGKYYWKRGTRKHCWAKSYNQTLVDPHMGIEEKPENVVHLGVVGCWLSYAPLLSVEKSYKKSKDYRAST